MEAYGTLRTSVELHGKFFWKVAGPHGTVHNPTETCTSSYKLRDPESALLHPFGISKNF